MPAVSFSHADCAVCARYYAPGFAYSCRSCVGDERALAIGVFSAFLVVAVMVVALVIAHLVRKIDHSGGSKSALQTMGCWSFIRRVADAIPITAVKIVVVVWQIVTQVRGRRVREAEKPMPLST